LRGRLAVLPAVLLAALLSVPCGPALAAGRVGLILWQLPPTGSAAYAAIRVRAGDATGQLLPLSKGEMWSVRKQNVAAVKRAAVERGALVVDLPADGIHLFRAAPAGLRLSAEQEAMVRHAREAKETTGVDIVLSPPPALIEYALTANARATGLHGRSSPIVLALGGTTLTLTRRSVDIKPSMCIWRGVVDATDMPATIMWWPGGKMAGLMQHNGRIYAIRHIGGEMHAIIESREDLMPSEHPQEHRDRP
jgi:hypothetical protein